MNATAPLPRVVLDVLGAVPQAGEGVHRYLFRAARQLHAHRTPNPIIDLLCAQVAGCGRQVQRQEVESAVANSRSCAWIPGTYGAGRHGRAAQGTVEMGPPVRWPETNWVARARITGAGFGLADLWEASPVRMDENAPGTEAIIDTLFHGNPLLCCGATTRSAFTRHREELQGRLEDLQLIVPNPMSAPSALTRDRRTRRPRGTRRDAGHHRSPLPS